MPDPLAKAMLSIADCPLCARLLQKLARDLETSDVALPPELDSLQILLELDDENTPAYCTSTTRLLRCPHCATYYYYNHYDDDGQHFMDPTSDDIVVRRYDPLTTLSFLEEVLAGQGGALPNTLGQLTRAFVYAESAPLTAVAGAGQEPLIAAVRGELDDLSTRYPSLIRSLEADLLRQDLPWHTQRYLCEAILNHYLSASDWDAISRLLLHHPDPVVRVAAAGLLVGIGFDDAPVIDLIHVPRRVSSYLETEIRRPPRLRELTNLLLDLALHCEADTLSYDHGYGTSKYTPQAIRIPALYHLVVLAGHRANLLPAVPALVGLLSQNTWLNYRVTWLMTEIAEHKVRGPQAILEALQAHPAVERQQWADDKNVVKLEAVCRERLEKRARKSVVSTR